MARVALCQELLVEYMGYMYISATLKEAGHTVEVFFDDQRNPDRFIAELKAFQPDIVGFSVLSPTLEWALNVGKRVKESMDAITIYGNVHPMLNPEIIEEEGVDIVCVSEGEVPMRELANCVDASEPYIHIEGLWVKTSDGMVKNKVPDELVDLNSLPYFDRGMYDKYWYFRVSASLRILLGRGCPFNCTFCQNPNVKEQLGGGKKYVRKLEPERAIQEIEYQLEQRRLRGRKAKHIFVADEVLWLKNSWLREFLALYKERIRLPFKAHFRFGPIEEEDIKLLAESGVQRLVVGIETGSEEQRRGMMGKNVTNEHIEQVAEWLHKYKIRFGAASFFGLPGDTVEDHVERLKFFRRVNPTYLATHFFEPYPKLMLTEDPLIQQYMPADRPLAMTFHSSMYLDLPDKARLENLKKIYYLCMRYPRLSPLLVWLTKFRFPTLFTALFLCHYAWHMAVFEGLNVPQILSHIKITVINPVLQNRAFIDKDTRPFWLSLFDRTKPQERSDDKS